MLRATLLFLTLGIGATLAGLYGFHVSRAPPQIDIADLHFSASTFDVMAGSGAVNDDALTVTLSQGSAAMLGKRLSLAAVEKYQYLVLNFSDITPTMQVSLGWSANAREGLMGSVEITARARQSIWIETAEISGWSGPADNLVLLVRGDGGDSFTLKDVQLLTYSLPRQVRNILQDWSNFTSWRRASMNSFSGVTKLSPFYPVVLVVCVLMASLAAYASWVLLFRRHRGIDWRVAGLVFLCCWLMLDFIWQHNLSRQVAETYEQFAGKTADEKLKAGPDAGIYALVSDARSKIAETNARVFIASSDSYTGLRAAYHMYPHNAFWRLRGAELPHIKYRKPGDYILLASPTTLRLNRDKSVLVTERRHIPVDILHDADAGTLLRLQ